MSIFKKEKHVEIIDEMKRRRKSNDTFCNMNDCAPSDYMRGVNDVLDELINYSEKLGK